MTNGLCTAMEGESRPAASWDQVMVTGEGEMRVWRDKWDGEGDAR